MGHPALKPIMSRSTLDRDSSYGSLPTLEAPESAPKAIKRTSYLLPALLLSATLGGLCLWVFIRVLTCESCSQLPSASPSKSHHSVLAPRAPPYQDPCVRNDDCDWGYKCIDNMCYPGCDEDEDCLKPQYCGAWYFPSKYGSEFCLVNDFRVCKTHLDFCRSGEDCCSGNCRRKGFFWKMCQPSSGRLPTHKEKSVPLEEEVVDS
ncbi:hypothetical protein N7492_004275 [Penicillium capsulatum]|uniref:Uncharacterized protein n=1 Tax=Penicillium capsulatum TaxID=69766 RepID=A0A9W9IB97_9EURO|nr:hypothetical protein N7492_004275 [Penicillium capsulatum]KAJ6136605.1 hypothetical protein N7512_001765 [Penicillium capsulatum]